MDDVVAFVAMEEVHCPDIGAGIGDDVVAGTTMDVVDAVAALEAIVAGTTPDRVVALAGHDMIVAIAALDDRVVAAVVADILGNPVAIVVTALDQFRERPKRGILVLGIGVAGHPDLLSKIHVEREIRS